MMAISKEDILGYISEISVLELSELVKEFEEKFGVTAKPVAIVNTSDDGNIFNITITNVGKNKKAVRNVLIAIYSISKKEAKKLLNKKKITFKFRSKRDAEKAIHTLKFAGAEAGITKK